MWNGVVMPDAEIDVVRALLASRPRSSAARRQARGDPRRPRARGRRYRARCSAARAPKERVKVRLAEAISSRTLGTEHRRGLIHSRGPSSNILSPRQWQRDRRRPLLIRRSGGSCGGDTMKFRRGVWAFAFAFCLAGAAKAADTKRMLSMCEEVGRGMSVREKEVTLPRSPGAYMCWGF